MATEAQYQFFKSTYVAEEERYAHLQEKAKFYLGVSSAYVAVAFFNVDALVAFTKRFDLPLLPLLIVAVAMTSGLAATVLAMTIRDYERASDPTDVIASLGDAAPSDAEFFDDRIIEYASAADHNYDSNNKVALCLQIAGWCIVLSVVGQLILVVWAIVRAALG